VKYVTECKKYRYGGVIARKFFLYAFDLIELSGDDLRRDPLEGRKATLAVLAVLAAATVFMMVELWQSASQMREGRRGEWPSGPAP
jgi:hypothetical protein